MKRMREFVSGEPRAPMLDLRLDFNCAKRDFSLRFEEGSEDGTKLFTEMPKSAAVVSAKFMGVEMSIMGVSF